MTLVQGSPLPAQETSLFPPLSPHRSPAVSGHFCQVRFLCRLAFSRFRRLCLFICSRRFFLMLPMV
jgi:hypothetical protein